MQVTDTIALPLFYGQGAESIFYFLLCRKVRYTSVDTRLIYHLQEETLMCSPVVSVCYVMKGMRRPLIIFFFECCFARKYWDELGINWVAETDLHRRIERSRQLAGLPFFMELFLIAAWEIWKIRNRLVLDGIQVCFNRWLRHFKEEAALQ